MKLQDISLPSPIHSVRYKDYTWDMKRDDLIHPYISGNKWRKLKYILQDAQQQNKNHLVSFGGAYSNHLVALAYAGYLYQVQTTAFVRGDEMLQNDQLDFCKRHQMRIIQVSREAYRDKETLYQKHYSNDPLTYYVDEGGMNLHALPGCAEILDEFTETYDHIFLACGTGTTFAGIVNACQAKNISTHVHGVVVLKTSKDIFLTTQSIFQNINRNYPHYTLHDNYHCGGYAKKNESLLQAINLFHEQNPGLQVEPVYTGKVLLALIDLMDRQLLSPSSKILMIHTGGIFPK